MATNPAKAYTVNLDRLRTVAKRVDDAVAQAAIRLERMADQEYAGSEQGIIERALILAAEAVDKSGFPQKAAAAPIARTEPLTLVEPEKTPRKRTSASKRPVSKVSRKK